MAQDEKMLVECEIARMREIATSWRRPTLAQVEGPNDLKIYGGTIADDIDRWADMLAALSAAPAQPAAVEGAGEPATWAIFWRHGVTTHPTREAALAAPGRTVQEPVALYAHPSPPADDALRVAVEALEDAAHEAHGRGYVQGFADAVWDETGDYDEKALTENLDPEKLRDGWYDDARHTYRDAQTEALAALKAGGVK